MSLESFTTTPSHKIRFIEAICQSFELQRRKISRNQSSIPIIVRCQTKERKICWPANNYHVEVKNPGGKND